VSVEAAGFLAPQPLTQSVILHEPLHGLEFKRLVRDDKWHAGPYSSGTKRIGGTCIRPDIRGDTEMAETAYPYATHLDIKFDPLN
jgi:hypothetical protein